VLFSVEEETERKRLVAFYLSDHVFAGLGGMLSADGTRNRFCCCWNRFFFQKRQIGSHHAGGSKKKRYGEEERC